MEALESAKAAAEAELALAQSKLTQHASQLAAVGEWGLKISACLPISGVHAEYSLPCYGTGTRHAETQQSGRLAVHASPTSEASTNACYWLEAVLRPYFSYNTLP